MTLDLIDEATSSGARLAKACDVLGISARTVQRWRKQDGGADQRRGPSHQPQKAFSEQERQKVLKTVNSPELRNLSPKQIVPTLAANDEYIGSEATIYRILRQEDQLTHHQLSRHAQKRTKPMLVAHGPNEVWTWDITYCVPSSGLQRPDLSMSGIHLELGERRKLDPNDRSALWRGESRSGGDLLYTSRVTSPQETGHEAKPLRQDVPLG